MNEIPTIPPPGGSPLRRVLEPMLTVLIVFGVYLLLMIVVLPRLGFET